MTYTGIFGKNLVLASYIYSVSNFLFGGMKESVFALLWMSLNLYNSKDIYDIVPINISVSMFSAC